MRLAITALTIVIMTGACGSGASALYRQGYDQGRGDRPVYVFSPQPVTCHAAWAAMVAAGFLPGAAMRDVADYRAGWLAGCETELPA